MVRSGTRSNCPPPPPVTRSPPPSRAPSLRRLWNSTRILGAIKLKNPAEQDLIGALHKETFLFHGAGSANLGSIALLRDEGGVPMSRLFITNSRGLMWRSADGKEGTWRNNEQKEFSHVGKPDWNTKDLV